MYSELMRPCWHPAARGGVHPDPKGPGGPRERDEGPSLLGGPLLRPTGNFLTPPELPLVPGPQAAPPKAEGLLACIRLRVGCWVAQC